MGWIKPGFVSFRAETLSPGEVEVCGTATFKTFSLVLNRSVKDDLSILNKALKILFGPLLGFQPFLMMSELICVNFMLL